MGRSMDPFSWLTSVLGKFSPESMITFAQSYRLRRIRYDIHLMYEMTAELRRICERFEKKSVIERWDGSIRSWIDDLSRPTEDPKIDMVTRNIGSGLIGDLFGIEYSNKLDRIIDSPDGFLGLRSEARKTAFSCEEFLQIARIEKRDREYFPEFPESERIKIDRLGERARTLEDKIKEIHEYFRVKSPFPDKKS